MDKLDYVLLSNDNVKYCVIKWSLLGNYNGHSLYCVTHHIPTMVVIFCCKSGKQFFTFALSIVGDLDKKIRRLLNYHIKINQPILFQIYQTKLKTAR